MKISNYIFIDGVATNYTLNTPHPYEVYITSYFWMWGLFVVKFESGDLYEVVDRNSAIYFDGFDSYTLRILRLPNIVTND